MFRARTAQNVVISVGLQWFNRFLGIVTRVFLARLLFPDDFGIFALATGVISFVGTFGNFGLDYAILHKGDKATTEDYDVAMSLRVVISLTLFLASVAIAGPWASLFSAPVLGPTTQVLAITYLVIPWSFVPQTRLTAELRYGTIAIPNLAGQLANSFISVGLAIFGFGVWSLVYGLLIAQFVSTAAFSAVHQWKFRMTFSRSVARPLMSYAQHIISASVLIFLITNVDDFTVGFYLGSTQLGFYAIAMALGSIPAVYMSGPAGSALFPSLVRIQQQPDVLRRRYLEGYGYIAAVIAPASVGMAVLAPEIVNILLGPMWAPATLTLLVLAFYGLAKALIDFTASLFAAVGRPRLIAELNLFVLAGSLVLLFPFTFAYGIVGTAVSMTIPVIAVAVVSISRSAHVLQGRATEFYRRLFGPIFAAETMGVVVLSLRLWLYSFLPERIDIPLLHASMHEATLVLTVGILLGVLVYFVVLRLVDRGTFDGLGRTLLMGIRPRGGQPDKNDIGRS